MLRKMGDGLLFKSGTSAASVLLALGFALAVMLLSSGGAKASPEEGLVVEDLTGPLTETDLADLLVGSGITVTNVVYTGTLQAAGTFSGGTGIIGFEQGVILSTGVLSNVIGPNMSYGITADNFEGGDTDLDALTGGYLTHDAAVLAFDVIPNEAGLFFNFVFASDEYNEYVGSQFNDVFAFFVNGINCAVVGGNPVTINTINLNVNSQLYLNNELPGATINTEMDGLTKVLTCNAIVTPGVENHVKLAIADTSDYQLDSNVFLKTGSFISQLPPRNYLPIVAK
jgi:hypothetical protein